MFEFILSLQVNLDEACYLSCYDNTKFVLEQLGLIPLRTRCSSQVPHTDSWLATAKWIYVGKAKCKSPLPKCYSTCLPEAELRAEFGLLWWWAALDNLGSPWVSPHSFEEDSSQMSLTLVHSTTNHLYYQHTVELPKVTTLQIVKPWQISNWVQSNMWAITPKLLLAFVIPLMIQQKLLANIFLYQCHGLVEFFMYMYSEGHLWTQIGFLE